MLDLEESSLQHGLLALVIALLEVIKDALVHAAVRRVEGGRLSEAEVERLGDALAELEEAVAQMKNEHGIEDAVRGVRDDLDQLVGRLVDTLAGREAEPLAAEPLAAEPGAVVPGAAEPGALVSRAMAPAAPGAVAPAVVVPAAVAVPAAASGEVAAGAGRG